jgi:hypothetical protein
MPLVILQYLYSLQIKGIHQKKKKKYSTDKSTLELPWLFCSIKLIDEMSKYASDVSFTHISVVLFMLEVRQFFSPSRNMASQWSQLIDV